MSIDPVIRDLNNYLDREDLEEELDSYIEAHGCHPCADSCEGNCKRCRFRSVQDYRRNETRGMDDET